MKKFKKNGKKKLKQERYGTPRQVINIHIHSGSAADKRLSRLTGDTEVQVRG